MLVILTCQSKFAEEGTNLKASKYWETLNLYKRFAFVIYINMLRYDLGSGTF